MHKRTFLAHFRPYETERLKRLEQKTRELHSNVRHIMQLAMGWFAFFVTVNYAAMSWLAKGSDAEGADPLLVQGIAKVFMVQDVLGAIGLFWVLLAGWAMTLQVSEFEKSAHKREDSTAKSKYLFFVQIKTESIPYHLYVVIGTFLIMVLISLTTTWCSIKNHYYYKSIENAATSLPKKP